MRKEPAEKYDVIVVDVFNSGSIPVHMATIDAIRGYQRVLKPKGVIFFHVSNLFVNLVPVRHANAKSLNLFSRWKQGRFQEPPAIESSLWVAITADAFSNSILKSRFNGQITRAPQTVKP
ncbi:MAG TPA: class I SAM-dependent methyltransferase [Sulfurimonas sp.]|nr:class I SAM-dependent methyltransferase [Sulfurimonas sp.]